MGHRRRLGIIAPSSNTVLEPQTARLLPADGSVTMHVARFRVTRIAADADSTAQFEFDAMLEAARQLADARVDLILWSGTAASWLGFARDERLTAAITADTGIPATTALLAVNARLSRLGARSIGLVTPYVEALEAAIVANYAGIGIETKARRRLDLTVNTDYADVTEDRIADMTRAVAAARPDAVVIMCTNLAGAAIAPMLEADLGVPVIDSVRAAVEHALEMVADPARQ
jgi:maleate isomerase